MLTRVRSCESNSNGRFNDGCESARLLLQSASSGHVVFLSTTRWVLFLQPFPKPVAHGCCTVFHCRTSSNSFRSIGNCTPLERKYYRNIVLYNLWEVFNGIRLACEELNYDFSPHKRNFDLVCEKWYNAPMSTEVASALRTLADDVTLRDCLRKSQSFMALSVRFFLDNIDRFVANDYVPDDRDILNSYAATVGTDYATYKTPLAFVHITDIGGSEFYRRKWDNFYTNVSLLIFVVDLAKFGKNAARRMTTGTEEESVTVFTELSLHPILKRAHLMLIFNKRDAFDEQQPQLNGAPPGGTEHAPTADRTTSLSMIRSKFLNQVTSRKVYQHTLSLLNRSNVEATITESINTVAKRNRIPSPT
ncbi:Guanine nucleotide-binding proteinalpha-7 subunit [Toxocara canis]|uniref:Guanine nucleotide-binding proteinalpha-7 subunit n=1 Tax=Toxocara canis TaxID=6265 RepID=A0A0B2VB33_TOXCA|nr:Guanine nucleotide-binding proteinalpha-7 subunit [Toxocara canis]